MCPPVVLAVTAAAAVASVGMQAYGAYTQSKAAKSAATYNAAISRNNSIIAERQAEDRIKQGKEEERTFRKQLSQLKGKQRSIYAGSGIVVDEGTPLEILEETAELGEIDALTIRRNAEREAYGFQTQANNFQNQAALQDSQANNINPFFDGSTTLLTKGTQAAFNFGLGQGTSAPTSKGV